MPAPRELFGHNDWANARLLAAASGLAEEARCHAPGLLGRSLAGTLRHIAEVERGWLDRWLGREGAAEEVGQAAPTLAALAEQFRATARERDGFFDRGAGAGLELAVTSGNGRAYPVRELALHVYAHGIHHRAQAQTSLRELGLTPPPLDYLFFRLDRPTVAQDDAALAELRQTGLALGDEIAAPAEVERGTLAKLYRYSDWACDRVLGSARALDAEALDRVFPFGPGGNLRKTLTHAYDAEAWWLAQWRSASPPEFSELPATTTVGELADRFASHAAERDRFLDRLDDAGFARVVGVPAGPGVRLRIRLGETAIQLPGHGIHHRAQASDMLRLLGTTPPATEFLDWVDHDTSPG